MTQLLLNMQPRTGKSNVEDATHSQVERILAALLAGERLTPLIALERFGCFRLGGRVYDLKKLGHDVQSRMIELPNGKHVAEYWIP